MSIPTRTIHLSVTHKAKEVEEKGSIDSELIKQQTFANDTTIKKRNCTQVCDSEPFPFTQPSILPLKKRVCKEHEDKKARKHSKSKSKKKYSISLKEVRF